MKKNKESFKKKGKWIIVVVLVVAVGLTAILASWKPVPYRVVTDYPMSMLVEGAGQMHQCAECHDAEDYHTCDTCHSTHGSADLANLNFYSMVHVTGDVPEEKYFSIYQLFSKRNEEINKIGVFDFLEDMDVTDFESVTFCTNDGGFSTITKENLGETSYLLPYEEGMRFADNALHVSTWLKGVNKIIIVTEKENLFINGKGYSFGELLLSDTVQFTVEQAPVMLKNEELDTLKTGTTATRLEGVELLQLMDYDEKSQMQVTCEDGSVLSVSGEESKDAKLVLIGAQINLVFPQSSRSQWIAGVKSIEVD